MQKENTIQQNFQRAKKNKHNYTISSQAFSLVNREFMVYNISLKKDYVDQYDYINYRRGLSYLEEIVNFNHTEPIIARKGLRKFKDLLPQYLQIKESHINKSKFHGKEKKRLFNELQNFKGTSYVLYNTQKLNGQNAQISFVYDKLWVVGSKNKCVLLSNLEDCQKLKNKHEHNLTLLIAKSWFSLLEKKSPQQINAIKLQLSTKTLIGQYCNTSNNQHLIDYGKDPQLFFYALVEKNNLLQDCLPTSFTYKFLQTFNLPKAKSQIIECTSYDETMDKLGKILVKMNESPLKQGGEGSVVYISGRNNESQQNLLVCKLKTIQYRIFRKLRQKLKVYFQKYNKNYDNLLKKYSKEIMELSRQFTLTKPLQYYIELGQRSFILCEDQTKNISRFIGKQYIQFMRLVEKNISKQKFLQIVNSNCNDYAQEEIGSQQIMKNQQIDKQQQQNGQNGQKQPAIEKLVVSKNKRVVILIPITIPSTGKTTLLQIIKASNPPFRIWSLSSDQIRRRIMDQMMKKMKNMTKQQAFQKSRDRTNKDYYKGLAQIFKNISKSEEKDHVLYLDKNHPQSAVKPALKQINDKSSGFDKIQIVKLGLFPDTIEKFSQKGFYHYPFSLAYMISCLKRVLDRPQHLTLQGNDEERCKIVIGFINLFRNFSMSQYNIKKYFDEKIQFKFNNEKCFDHQDNYQLVQLFKEILLCGIPGSFQVNHARFEQFMSLLKEWKLQQIPRQICAEQALEKLVNTFKDFQNIKNKPQKLVQ